MLIPSFLLNCPGPLPEKKPSPVFELGNSCNRAFGFLTGHVS